VDYWVYGRWWIRMVIWRYLALLGWAALVMAWPCDLQADGKGRGKVIDQKQDLEQIQQELVQGQKRLDSLKGQESAVKKAITGYDQRIESDRKVARRLSRGLDRLADEIGSTEDAIQSNRSRLQTAKGRFNTSLRRFYLTAREPESIIPDSPNEALELNRKVNYLASLVQHESGNVADAGSHLQTSIGRYDELSGESRKVSGLKRKREASIALEKTQKEKKERNLERIRHLRAEEADRILMLHEAEKEVGRIITRLEEELRRTSSGRRQSDPSVFAALRGQLCAPCRGTVTRTFGPYENPITKLKSFSPGITIKSRSGRPVVAVAAGDVAYVGNLRGYGDFIIINHDDHHFSTYSGITTPTVVTGQYVLMGTDLAKVGSEGSIKFELRKGREPIDPIEWIRVDSF